MNLSRLGRRVAVTGTAILASAGLFGLAGAVLAMVPDETGGITTTTTEEL